MSHEHPEGRGYERIRAQTTLQEILETASSFEQTAYHFYSALQTRVSKRLRPLLEELAAEEQQHYELFQALGQLPEAQAQITEKVKIPPNDHRFSDYIHLPELGEHPDDQTVLQYAMGREQAAMEQYQALAADTPGGPIRDLFMYLAYEELAHKRELEKRYYELIHSGGV